MNGHIAYLRAEGVQGSGNDHGIVIEGASGVHNHSGSAVAPDCCWSITVPAAMLLAPPVTFAAAGESFTGVGEDFAAPPDVASEAPEAPFADAFGVVLEMVLVADIPRLLKGAATEVLIKELKERRTMESNFVWQRWLKKGIYLKNGNVSASQQLRLSIHSITW